MHYNKRVSINCYIRNNKNIKEELIEISIGKLMKIVGVDYFASGPPRMYFHESINDLLDSL